MNCRVRFMHVAAMLGAFALMAARGASSEPAYRFDDSLVLGAGLAGGSLERFNSINQVDPGTYLVDLYLNKHYISRSEVVFRNAGDAVQPCFSEHFLQVDLGVKGAPEPDADAPGSCLTLGQRLPSASFKFDSALLRLDLSVPQALLDLKPRGYVSPREWEGGSSMAFVNYDANLYRSRYGFDGNGDSSYGYLGLNGGVNLGLWRLRHQSNYSYTTFGGNRLSKWNSVRTYAQRAIPQWRSELTVGDSYTEGNLFGSVGFRGARLASDDRMLPDSQRQYAPQVRGTANSSARVVISQDGSKVHETTVAPGPFVIDDLYGTAYNGDLDVQVIEADGSVSQFTVPYSAVPDSIRPGLSRYNATVGEVRQNSRSHGTFGEFIYQHGLSNELSANLGLRVAEDYLAALGGGVLATAYGAVGFNTTFSSATVENNQRKQGWRLGLNYSRTFQPTDTTVTLAGYRYSTEGYRDLGDALGARDTGRREEVWDSSTFKQRNQLTLMLNQNLSEYGNLFLNGSRSDYYDGKSRDLQLQFGYSNTWRQLSYSLAYSRQRTLWYQDSGAGNDPLLGLQPWGGRTSNRNNVLTLSLSMPLGSSSSAPSLSSTLSRRSGDSRGSSVHTGLNGTLGDQSTTSYAIAAGRDSNGRGTDWNANLQTQTSLATLNGGYSQGANYRQINGGLRGAAVLHGDGLTLGPYVGDTFALVQAKGAAGAVVRGGQGARVDRNGYAVVPALSPYRYNAVGLDPQGIGEQAELVDTERKVAPYAGAAVLVTFKTLAGHALLIRTTLANGTHPPLGADVVDGHGTTIGLVGQGGQVYARAEGEKGRLHVRWGERAEDGCWLPYDLAAQPARAGQALVLLEGVCLLTEEQS
ncbi:fimbria/pilus outer membrane usher protein [Pseudomonas parafulva]|uniref:fimbria/pilus outer membrane usher protein n=1 Tax=Pseudomonas parafulva TaxID=157782 RepID=UPI00048E0EA1